MKKQINKLLVLILLFLVILSSTCLAKDIEVVMDGEKLLFDNSPILEEGRTLVPFRKIFEILEYEVSWNSEERSVLATKNGKELKLTINSKDIFVNDDLIVSDVAPRLINSTTYVPIRIISEYSDCDVLWDDKTKTVLIYSKQEPYKQCVPSSHSMTIATDGEYIYYRDCDNVYKFTENFEKEEYNFEIYNPYAIYNSWAIYKNKIYGLVNEEGDISHLKSFDLKTLKEKEVSEENIEAFVIHKDKIYYLNKDYEKKCMNVMDISGKNKKQICSGSHIYDFFVTDEYIFSQGRMYSIETGAEKVITNKYVSETAIDDENYYMVINDYINSEFVPIGIYVYNYKTQEDRLYSMDKEITDIDVTENSVFLTWVTEEKDQYNHSMCAIARLTKKFEYPIEIYKGYKQRDENNNEKIFTSILSEIDVIGNHIYINDGKIRVQTNGEHEESVVANLNYDINNQKINKEKYTLADFTEEFGIKIVGNSLIKDIRIKSISKFEAENYYELLIRFDIKDEYDSWIIVIPFSEGEFIVNDVSYDIINYKEVIVKHIRGVGDYKNNYMWRKGGHNYHLGTNSSSKNDLYNIINGISINITDKEKVEEYIMINDFYYF